jgi:ubiquinone/menaquinone biosynthesis C-methylase UbiE
MAQPKNWLALWPHPERVVRSLGIRPGMTVVEFCCNNGYFTVPLAKLVGGNLYVFDIDPEVLGRARAEVTRAGASVRGWIWDDTEDLARVLPNAVDVVFMANALNSVSDKPELARTVSSALKPNGRFAVIDWHQLPRERTTVHGQPCGPVTETRISPDEIRVAVEPAGFALSDVVELPPYHYGVVFHKIDSEKR